MPLTPRLDLRQTQTLVMTPQLQQAIRLLQFSNVELTAFVESQLEQNPLLERDYSGGEETPGEPGIDSEPGTPVVQPAVSAVDAAVGEVGGDVSQSALDVDYDNIFDSDGGGGASGEPVSGLAFDGMAARRPGSALGVDETETLEGTLSSAVSLRDHLLQQLAVDVEDPVDRIIGLYLIESLDEAGYLRADLAQLAERIGCPLDRVEATLGILQQFDPAGLFARSLSECLMLQLAERGRLDAAMRRLLEHLDLVGRHDISGLAGACGVPPATVVAMITELRSLDPKPAQQFDTFITQPVTPDVMMRPDRSGGWIVELNSETLPRVLVNNQYYVRICQSSLKKDEKTYVNECFQAANWLVKSLHQRASTILKVSSELVRQQDGFFRFGVQALRPLVLRDIAEAVDLHESTVSRVTSNKFIATPRGIFELKYFFSQAIGSSSGGDAHSAEWVRHRIRGLIEAEPPGDVLSDDAIVRILGREGIDIARRTVAKYREAMGIPSSVQRRRAKLARA